MDNVVKLPTPLERAEKAAEGVSVIQPSAVLRCECGHPERSWYVWEGGQIQCTGCNGFIQDMICIEHGGKVT